MRRLLKMQERKGKRKMYLESLWETVVLLFLGLAAGIMIAGGLFAFVVKVGVITRLVTATRTAKYIPVYEDVLVVGVTIANTISLYQFRTSHVGFILPFCGVFSGIYVGCLAVALAEVVNVMPVFARRVKLKYGMSLLIVAFAIGKMLGTWYQFLW